MTKVLQKLPIELKGVSGCRLANGFRIHEGDEEQREVDYFQSNEAAK
jgi:hypothetical protein